MNVFYMVFKNSSIFYDTLNVRKSKKKYNFIDLNLLHYSSAGQKNNMNIIIIIMNNYGY